jgi:MerR family transcriptional regulator, redox-sensitive transcriptional activator SoxR
MPRVGSSVAAAPQRATASAASSSPAPAPPPASSPTAVVLSVGDVAHRAGVSVSTLHFWEQEGLIRSRRSAGNQRRYSREVLRRVAVIRAAQRVGIGLDELRAAFSLLPDDAAPSREEWARLSKAWREGLDGRIEQLRRLRDTLDSCIGCGCLSLRSCALRNPADALGQQGPGARRLWVGIEAPARRRAR